MLKNLLIASVILLFSEMNNASSIDPEIGGLVLDRSISRFGKNFYREFSTLWRESIGTQNVNAVVLEKNIPQSGTVLWLEINGTRVYQTFFGRRQGTTVKRLAEEASRKALDFVLAQMMPENNPDIANNGY